MAYGWPDKVVLITGASSGIGRALALELARRGARVALFARRAELLVAAAEEIERGGGKALALPGDVRDPAQVERAVERVNEKWGRVDVLLANSGVGVITPASALDARGVADVIAVNTVGVVNCVAAVLPGMLERKSGHLVAVSSLAAFRGLPKSAAYSASKAAVSTFFESLRVDLKGTGVDVTTIHPGFIKTPMTEGRKGRLAFLLELDEGVRHVVRAIESRRRTYAFPWQLASFARLGRLMPPALYDRIAARRFSRE